MVTLLVGSPLFGPYRLQLRFNNGFALLDLPSQDVISHPLQFQCCLVQTQLSVQLIGTTFVLFAQTLMSFTGLGLSFASTLRPLLQSGEMLLEMGSPLGHLRVLHRHLGETVIRVQSQRESSSL